MKTHWLWNQRNGEWVRTDRQFDWNNPADLGHEIRCLRDDLGREVSGKRLSERPYDPLKVPIGFGSDTQFAREFDGQEFRLAEIAIRDKLVAIKRRNGMPAILPG